MKESRLELKLGARVETTDGPFGHIRQQILDPSQGRVTGLVVRGNFPDQEHIRPGMLPDEIPRKERQVVLPIYAVHIVSISGVLLTASAADAARCPDFDPGEFIVPDSDWQPPYPYKSSEVLLDPTGLHVQKVSREVPEGTRRG